MIRAVGVTRLVRDPEDPTKGTIETLDPTGAVIASEPVEGLDPPVVVPSLEEQVAAQQEIIDQLLDVLAGGGNGGD